MEWSKQHAYLPESSLDGDDLGWDTGLLLLVLRQMEDMKPGDLLELSSINPKVETLLPVWCQKSRNELLSQTKTGDARSFLLCKGRLSDRDDAPASAMEEPARLVVRRLPPLALLSLGMVHPGADVVPFSFNMEFRQLTTVMVPVPPEVTCFESPVRTEIDTLLEKGVQLIRVDLRSLETDAENLSGVAGRLQLLLSGLPPERMAVELDRPADEPMVEFLSVIPVGNVIVPATVSELEPLRQLSVEKRLALRVDTAGVVGDVLTKSIELFGIERLMICTHTTVGEELNALAEAVGRIRQRYGVSGQTVEYVY